MAKTNVKIPIGQLKKHYYVHRHKPIRFNGLPVMSIPARNKLDLSQPSEQDSQFLDEFDTLFESHQDYVIWNKEVTKGLAELDEAMNYCEYFVRDKGNKGHYVREGKSFPVDGSWVGTQDFDNYKPCQPFVQWLSENGWRDTWFKLHHRYDG